MVKKSEGRGELKSISKMLQSLHNNSGLKPAVVITVNREPTTVNGY